MVKSRLTTSFERLRINEAGAKLEAFPQSDRSEAVGRQPQTQRGDLHRSVAWSNVPAATSFGVSMGYVVE